jgi:SAM-dependent methyltransferase
MNGPPDALEAQIIRSWNINAKPWARAIQAASILSRTRVTDRAIVDAVSSVSPGRVFDLGCGEGWLSRALSALGIEVTGVDAVPELVAQAMHRGGGRYQVADYLAIAERRLECGPFDAAVCNFSLLGKESVNALLSAIPHYVDAAGHLIVQTLHPVAACGEHPYQDGWRAGNWAGFGAEFSDPLPGISALWRAGCRCYGRTDSKYSSAANPRPRMRSPRPPSSSYARLGSLEQTDLMEFTR